MSQCKVPEPTGPKPHLGIEIEHYYREFAAGPAALAANHIPNFVLNEEYCGPMRGFEWEGKLLVPQDAYEEPLKAALDLIKEHDAQTHPGYGIHVHVDRRDVLKRSINCRTWIEDHRQHLLSLVNPVRATGNQWGGRCYSLHDTIPTITAVRGYKTFEVRCLGNTLDFTEIKTFIDKLVELVESCPSNTPPAYSQPVAVAA